MYRSYAKINLAINVIDKLDNGYHELDMIMSKINLFDKLNFEVIDEDEIIINCNNSIIPTNQHNLIYKVIDKVKKTFNIDKGIIVDLYKLIPSRAGLGGGSSNAATTLEALNDLFQLDMSLADKINFTKDLGADIAFFYQDKMARVQGVGDIIKPFNTMLNKLKLVIVKPKFGLSTKLVYQNLDLNKCTHPNIDEVLESLLNNDYTNLIKNIDNSLQASAMRIKPELETLVDHLIQLGCDKALVSGSGSSIFAFYQDDQVVNNIKQSTIYKSNFVFFTTLRG